MPRITRRRGAGVAALAAIWLAMGFSCSVQAAEQDPDLQEILKRAVEANRRVKNFSGVSREYEPMNVPGFAWAPHLKSSEMIERSPEGFALMAQHQIVFDRVAPRWRYDTRQFTQSGTSKPSSYLSRRDLFDGNLYRYEWTHKNTGGRRTYSEWLGSYPWSLHTLLGDGLGGDLSAADDANLVHWLSQSSGWSGESKLIAAGPRLTRLYGWKQDPTSMRVEVTLSPEHGYLPSSIETYWCDTQTLCNRVTVEKFHKVMPEGIWVPVRGILQSFYRDVDFPPGVTRALYKKMSAEEKKRVDAKITFKAVPLNVWHVIEIDPQTIKLNQKLADSTFIDNTPAAKPIIWDWRKAQRELLEGKDSID